MLHDTGTILFHVKHANRPGLPGRIRFSVQSASTVPTCT